MKIVKDMIVQMLLLDPVGDQDMKRHLRILLDCHIARGMLHRLQVTATDRREDGKLRHHGQVRDQAAIHASGIHLEDTRVPTTLKNCRL